MKKTKLFKSLLVAAGLCVGASAWAEDTYETVYTRAAVTDWSDDDKTDWGNSSLIIDDTNGLYFNPTNPGAAYSATKTFTIAENAKVKYEVNWYVGSSTGRDSNYEYIQFGDKVRISWNSNYWFYLNTNGTSSMDKPIGSKGGNTIYTKSISIIFDTAKKTVESFTFDGIDLSSYVSDALEGSLNKVTFGLQRGGSTSNWGYPNGLKTITVSQCKQTVTTANYTINYKLNNSVVKTVSSTSVVGAEITADMAVDGEGDYAGNHYVITANAAPSITLVAGDNTLDVPVRAPYAATLKVTTTVNGTANEETIALTETDTKDCSYSYAYSKYVKSGDVYYVCDATKFAFNGTFTDGEVIEKTVSYTNADENIVFFHEAESVAGKDENCSWGGGGNVGAQNARNRGVSVGTLPAGTYMFEVNILGDNRRSLVLRQSTNDPMASVGTSNEDHSTGLKSAFFTLTVETENLWINGANSGEAKTNQSEDYDYVVIRKISSMSIVGDFSENGWVTESGIEMTQDAENPAIWTAVVENFEVTSDKLNYEYKAVANGKYSIYDLPASGNQNYNFDYEGAGAGFYNLTFTVNTTANTVELAIEKQKQSFTVSYVNTENKAKLYAYTFNAEELGGWPGTEMTKSTEQVNGFDVYTITFKAYNAPEKIIFTDNASWQTDNLDFVNNSQYGIAWPELTIGDAGYRTYCSPFALDFSEVEGLTAYRATISGTNVSFVEVTEVPANEGILLKGAANTYTVKPIAQAKAIENIFVGTVTGTTAPAGSFVLMAGTANNAGTGFYQTKSDFTVGANTAYIPASVAGARTFIGFDFDNTTTAIEGVATVKENNGEIYNLQGQRVMKAQKGLYIINGKKVLVK